ncbi:MAG TPA: DUF5615 family PIN-like protein [Candidatus Tectomicrobia bacterium]
MDVHIPAAITAGLRRRNIDVLTSQQDKTRQVDDESLLAQAAALGRLLFSQDQDLLRIATNWQRTSRDFAGLVFASQQATSIGQLIEALELVAQCCTSEEVANHIIFYRSTDACH